MSAENLTHLAHHILFYGSSHSSQFITVIMSATSRIWLYRAYLMYRWDIFYELTLTWWDIGDPECKCVWNDGVQECQCEGAALRVGTWWRHIRVIETELRTPCLQTGFAGLLHVRRPWGWQYSKHTHTHYPSYNHKAGKIKKNTM